MSNKYDYVVIGSGPAGHSSAIRAAQLGLNVAVVEKDPKMFGGVCLNEGCIPAKSLLNDAHIFSSLKQNGAIYGSDVNAEIDMEGIVKKSRSASRQLSKGLEFLFKKNKITRIEGTACFADDRTLEVDAPDGKTVIKADKFLIASGSVPRQLPGIEFDGKYIWNSSDAIRASSVPRTILIVGGGAIGCEFASFFNMVGSEVTLIEAESSILPLEDKEVSRRMQSIFKKNGVIVKTSSRIRSVSKNAGTVVALIGSDVGSVSSEFDAILVAVGRTPLTSALQLEAAGVEVDEKGFIKVDDRLASTAPGVFAAGDVIATPMLAHSASAEGELAAEAAAGRETCPIDYDCMPNVVYTDVGAASVGITEEEAKEKGLDYSSGKQFFLSNGRAVANSCTEGFVKVIAENSSHKILGAHILNHDAPELIHEFVVAKKGGMKVEDVAKAIHAHPTLSETALDACKAVFGKPLNG